MDFVVFEASTKILSMKFLTYSLAASTQRAMSVGILEYFALKRRSSGFPYQVLMALYL